MTLAQIAAERRKELEKCGKLPHDKRFDDRVKRESHNCIILLALLTAGVYVLSIDAYYRFNYAPAQSGEIRAKSEMSKAEVKALNIAKAPAEKRHVK
jgi:hypothetical protein